VKEEFKQFLEAPECEVPASLSHKISSHIHNHLKVKAGWLTLKLFIIHSLVAALTLSVCPQFNVSYSQDGPSHAFYSLMKIHVLLCASLCGLVFLGSSALVLTLILKKSELLWLKKKSWGIYSLLTTASLMFFMILGSAFRGHFNPAFVAMWAFTAIFSAWAITQVGTHLRIRTFNFQH